MRLSIAWLKTYLPKLPTTSKLVDTLVMHGLDVESVVVNDAYDRVVIGQIVGIKPHPNADKLRLADVITSPNGSPQEIVCGAPNIEVGQKVPVALLGARLSNGLTIAKRAIRGVESNGMLCAADELGLGTDHSGIMVLDPKARVGSLFSDIIGASDEVIDLTTPANRADLMAVRGLAWEIGAMLGQAVKFPPLQEVSDGQPGKNSITLDIVDPKQCSLLTARVVRGVTMQPTPTWMVTRLRSAGMRSINIIADITNYLMLDYGQPLHAYDASKVHGRTLIARPATPEEQLKTLDGKLRTLSPEMLVIADADRAIGLAGVMGGGETEVRSATTDVILEAAIFDPVSIRKTSRQLGLISEASKRFEKGLWPSLPGQASAAATALIVELCGGTAERVAVRVGTAKSKRRTITLDPAYISERLGMKVTTTTSRKILTRLGFVVQGTAKSWIIAVPEWRPDAALPEDVVDEVGRMVGYEKLPERKVTAAAEHRGPPPAVRFKEEVKNILVDLEFTEVISHAFYSAQDAKRVQGKHFEIANPLDVEQQKLRKSLLPEIFNTLKRQADAGEDAAIFEIGYVFDPEMTGTIDRQQVWKLGLGIAHKGAVRLEETVRALQAELVSTVEPAGLSIEGPFRGRYIEYGEFDLKELRDNSKVVLGPWDPNRHIASNVTYREQSKFPVITRDISFWWPSDERSIRKTIDNLRLPLLRNMALKDTFTKNGNTSYAFTFVYQSSERTLTREEVDGLEKKIKDALQAKGAAIR